MIPKEELCVEAMLNLERGYMFICEIVRDSLKQIQLYLLLRTITDTQQHNGVSRYLL